MNPPEPIPFIPKTGRIGHLAEIIEQQAGHEILLAVMQEAENFTSTSSYPRKAAWIREMIQRLEGLAGVEKATMMMRECGRGCCGERRAQSARQWWESSTSLEEFLQRLNENHLGGGRLKLVDPATIAGGYDRCYCGQVKQARMPFPTQTYCQCSAGWYQQLFETALGESVRVELVQSILSGARSCEFLIHIT